MVGGGSEAFQVDSASRRVVRRFDRVVDAAWGHGRWRLLSGRLPDIDDLPGAAGSRHVQKVGTVFPLTFDEGWGSLSVVVTRTGFDFRYRSSRRIGARPITVGPKWFEIEGRPFCFPLGKAVLIGLPLRSVDGFELWQYERGRVHPYSFDRWRRAPDVNPHGGGQTLLTSRPVWIAGHLIASGFRLAEDAASAKTGNDFFLDFTATEIRKAPSGIVALASNSSASRVAVLARVRDKAGVYEGGLAVSILRVTTRRQANRALGPCPSNERIVFSKRDAGASFPFTGKDQRISERGCKH